MELINEVEKLGGEIVITRHRKPVARLLPAQSASTGFCGCLKGAVVIHGDIVSPIDAEWTADEANLT
ncbi:MAG: type II toxin-antitoxin system prevent-host-death family antitoxin [Candidatus Eremiobacteraeota bacterium]|nr:type II toxin-antitoxin system prevent-host-death family antitoxin [Candidatus Eremiobacteraeota bacterium]